MEGVLKPGRYINNEWNAVHKEWKEGFLKIALCFPDIYEIGMSHLGMKILYGILNKEKDIICERVFAPWSDKEERIRSRKEILLSLESKSPLNEFDIIGFSLQYEMNYVDVLNMLDLGQVPLRAKDRGDTDPIVIAGGPCAFNPEPMAEFIDAFVIGEAEEAILEIMRVVKGEGWGVEGEGQRNKVLKEIAKIKSVYVPAFTLHPSPFTITRRIIGDLDNSYFPTNPVVPYIQIVHDRIGIEIMRGCPHACRFCQACKISYPLRIRSVKRILEIAEASVKNTGYGEISLVSLSSGDYPYLEELVQKLQDRFKDMGVKISLPSLRVGSFDSHDEISVVKRAGLTFAPEAGTERLRNFLNKNIKDEDIIQKSRLALNSGWKKVKLYFMLGLPGETYADLDAIIELASKVKNATLSISPFIPKPHSEFEAESMDEIESLKEKQRYLSLQLKVYSLKHSIRMDFHDAEMSRIEAVLSRGDRRIGEVVLKVWKKGARLQAWTEHFDYGLWDASFQEGGLDPEIYLKKKGKEEILPWSFVK